MQKTTYKDLENENLMLRQELETIKRTNNFNDYFENNKQIMLQVDSETKQIINANSSALKFYGYSKNDLLSKKIYDLQTLPPNEINAKMENAVKNKSNFFYFKHILSNKEIRDVEAYASPIKINNKIQMLVSVFDISNRTKLEQEIIEKNITLEENVKKYKNLFDNSPISLWEKDFSDVIEIINKKKQEGITDFKTFFDTNTNFVRRCAKNVKILRINKETLKLLKYKSKTKLLKNIPRIVNEKSLESFKNKLLSIINGKTEFTEESELICADGTIISVIIKLQIFKNYKIILSIVDVTGHKKAEKKLFESKKNYKLLFENNPSPLIEEDYTEVKKLLLGKKEVLRQNVWVI